MMLIKVLIRRLIQDGRIKDVRLLLQKLRVEAMNQPGYFSGETLINQDDSNLIMVISIWQTVEDWMKWKESKQRLAHEAEMEKLLQEPATYEEYEVVSTNLWKLV